MPSIDAVLSGLNALQVSPEVQMFIENNLLNLVLIGLAFGFANLLVEIRLPLKYYWDLPMFVFRQLLSGVGILKKVPEWGQCVEDHTNHPIPIAAVELLEAESKMVVKTTFSDRTGQYGFKVVPGDYIVRSVKNHYQAPPFYDPENIRLQTTDESFAIPIKVQDGEWPKLNLVLQPVDVVDHGSLWSELRHGFKTFSINLSNGLLVLSILGAWYGWLVDRSALFAVLLAVGIVFAFIKLYILEAVGNSAYENHA